MTQLKTKIMRRVYVASYMRRVLSPVALKFYAIGFLLWGIGREVWVAQVLHNAPGLSRPLDNFNFFSYALVHAHLMTQALVLSALALTFWSLRDLLSRRPHALIATF